MLIIPKEVQQNQHKESRNGLVSMFNEQLEKILNDNKKVDKYWILGKIKTEKHGSKTVIKPFLQGCLEKPGLIKESFVYEVDSRKGTKTLLWVLHSDDTLNFPTLGKSLSVTGSKRV